MNQLRWRLWGLVTRSRRVCPANAYARILDGQRDRTIRVDHACRRDLAANGFCFCNNLTRQP